MQVVGEYYFTCPFIKKFKGTYLQIRSVLFILFLIERKTQEIVIQVSKKIVKEAEELNLLYFLRFIKYFLRT